MKRYLLAPFFVLFIFLLSCSDKSQSTFEPSLNILATIGDKSITVNDFLKRCEYVPRPNYCKNNNYIHKKIALNSLIAEKILSVEFEKKGFIYTAAQENLIIGQKEQAMRQMMLKIHGFEKVVLDPKQINVSSKIINRTYDVSFVLINDNQNERVNQNSIQTIIDIKNLLKNSVGVSQKTISINDKMPIEIKRILFFSDPKKGELFGPIHISNNKNMYFEIQKWNTKVLITEKEKEQSLSDSRKMYHELYALKKYEKYVASLMSNKSINFQADVFSSFSNKLSQIFLIEREKKESVIQGSIWRESKETNIVSFDDLDEIKKDILLTFDNELFTVADVLKMIKKHPLVFRNKDIIPSMFSNELKYALVDLFRDNEITKEAYKNDLDKMFDISQVEKKWKDHIAASIIKNKLNKKTLNKDEFFSSLVTKIDSLQRQYSNIIKIDTDKFEKIKITNIDMNVVFTNQAYPIFEPAFPILTDDHILDYGQKYNFN